MKTLTILLFLSTLLNFSTPVRADQSEISYLPEFCVATFLVTGQGENADHWLETYDLDATVIAFIQFNLELLLKEGEVRGKDMLSAAAGCIDADEVINED